MLEFIKKYKNTPQILEIFERDRDADGSFRFGFIRAYDDNHVLIEKIDTVGQYGGLAVINIEEIIEIKANSMYSTKFQNYLAKTNYTPRPLGVFGDVDKGGLLKNFLEILYKNQQMATVMSLSLMEYRCFISGPVPDESIELAILNGDGCRDGIIPINLSDILSVSIESRMEKRFEILHSVQLN